MSTPFYEKYRKLCSERGKSDNAVAAEIGLSNSTVTTWKQGAIPRRPTIKKVADYFGISVEEMMGYSDIEKAPIPEDERQKELDRLATEIREQTRMMKTVVDSTYNFYSSLKMLAGMDRPIPRDIAYSPDKESDIQSEIAVLIEKFMKTASREEKSEFLSKLQIIEEEFRRQIENPSETPYPSPEEIEAYGEMAKNLAMQQFLSEEKPDARASSAKESDVG